MVLNIRTKQKKSSAETADVELQSRAGAKEGGVGEVHLPGARRVRRIRLERRTVRRIGGKEGGSTRRSGGSADSMPNSKIGFGFRSVCFREACLLTFVTVY